MKRLEAISFMRVIAAIGIVFYHFCGSTDCETKIFYQTANGYWGTILVTIFFAISGAVLFYNYPKVPDLKKFYYKRWKSIFPAFYICFFYYFTQNVLNSGKVFYAGNPGKLLLSLFAVDGYFYYKGPNYYIIGEWFIGAIVLLYVIYPFLSRSYVSVPWITTVAVAACYLVLFTGINSIFTIDVSRNLFTCIFSFFFGIVIIDHKEIMDNNKVLLLALILSVCLLCIKVPIQSNIIQHICGFCLFIVLYRFGQYIMKNDIIHITIKELDKISYPIFLFQHRIIDTFLAFRNPTVFWKAALMAFIVLGATIICAKVLSIITDAVLKSPPMMRLNTIMLGNQ